MLCALSSLCHAQDDISSKFSKTTQMFLKDRDSKAVLSRRTISKAKRKKISNEKEDGSRLESTTEQIYVEPEICDGVTYISAFIRVENVSKLNELEAKGVRIHCKFDNGLFTAIIPVDSIESVAKLKNVKRINVSQLLRKASITTREKTNVLDVLTCSARAGYSALKKTYDGSGVIIGVIDEGFNFQHIAFKDKNGNSRIKRAYISRGSLDPVHEYTSISNLTTDNGKSDHGTHVASIAGGSSVIINKSTDERDIFVTNEHDKATFGGMAPGADLCLAGIKDLNSVQLTEAMKYICEYAKSVGKPLVLNCSWENQLDEEDGLSEVLAKYFGDNNPNHICLFAAGNDGAKSVNPMAKNSNVISVGAYVSKLKVEREYRLPVMPDTILYATASDNQEGDIAEFSSYIEPKNISNNQLIPWITAPGCLIVGAINQGYSLGFDDLVNLRTDKYLYGCKKGTSTASAVVSGIVALWLQAAKETNVSLTTTEVKNIMKQTAIKDEFTSGPNASHFGNGKIDALAGINAILDKTRKAPELSVIVDDFYNKLTINCKMDGQRGSMTFYRKTGGYPEKKDTKDITKDAESFVYDTEFMTAGDYFAEIHYNGKTVSKYFSINPAGPYPKLAVGVNENKDIDVKFKFSHSRNSGELRLYKYSDVQKGFTGVNPLSTYNIDNRYNGHYTISSKNLDPDNYTVALYENGNFVTASSIYSPSGIKTSIYDKMSMLTVSYDLYDITKKARFVISRIVKRKGEDLPINDRVFNDSIFNYAIGSDNTLDFDNVNSCVPELKLVNSTPEIDFNDIYEHDLEYVIDVEKGKSGSQHFYYNDWKEGNYRITLYQDGKETASTVVNIAPLGLLKKVTRDNNNVYVTYSLGETAKSAYVTVTNSEATKYCEQDLSLTSTQCTIRVSFRGSKYVFVTLHVNGIPVSQMTIH